MSFQNLMGIGKTLLEAQQDLENRIEVAKGMGLVVLEIQSYSAASIHYACARMCGASMKQALDTGKHLWYTCQEL